MYTYLSIAADIKKLLWFLKYEGMSVPPPPRDILKGLFTISN